MRVAVNLSFLLPGVVGGSEEYSVRLLRAVLDHHPDVRLDVVAHDALFQSHPALEQNAVRIGGPVGLGLSGDLSRSNAGSHWLVVAIAQNCADRA